MPSSPSLTPNIQTTKKYRLLIVDDDEAIQNQLKWALTENYDVLLAGDRETALRLFKKRRPPLVALDLGLPPAPRDAIEGLRILEEILTLAPETKVVIISGNMEKENALKAIASGAYDFFSKPVEIEELQTILKRALHLYLLEKDHKALQQKLRAKPFGEMEGQSEPMLQIFTTIRKVASTDASVLILGESGTGKELISRAIHQKSRRKAGPFIVINCGAIPGELLESELFGHEKGAFTGAHVQRKGKVEFAEGGTLLLDEIGEMPLPLQVKLLRFLQDYKIERVGGREGIKVDTRIIAATNSDLKNDIREGRFREDLYYRLNVVTIAVPPLRERGSDLELLCNIFLRRYNEEYRRRLKGFSPDTYESIRHYPWPGNVRELENKVKRAVIMAEGKFINPEDLELPAPSTLPPPPASLRDVRDRAEREHVLETLARNKGNISQTAEELGVSRPTLYEVINRLGINKNPGSG